MELEAVANEVNTSTAACSADFTTSSFLFLDGVLFELEVRYPILRDEESGACRLRTLEVSDSSVEDVPLFFGRLRFFPGLESSRESLRFGDFATSHFAGQCITSLRGGFYEPLCNTCQLAN